MITRLQAIWLTFGLFILIGVGVIALKAAPHIPILAGIMILLAFGFFKRISWSTMEQGMRQGISAGIPSIFIFLLVGILIAVWIASGTIPTLMVFGFELFSTRFFLVTVFVVCAIVGTSIGSAFTTAATVGLAFLGIGEALGYNPALVAGAIVSGAFFGDKMSPLSDTTNLAPAISAVDMFAHIRNMMWTTIPAFVVTVILFLALETEPTKAANTTSFISTLHAHAHISWLTLLPVLVLFLVGFKKVPAIPSLLAGIVAGIIILFASAPHTSPADLIQIMQSGFKSETGVENIDRLLTRGGLESMLSSAALIFLALGMGGLLQALGIIEQLMGALAQFVQTTGKLIASTALTAIGVNFLIGEQYLSIILPGQTFAGHFDKLGLERKNLSRVLEDAGTVVNPLVPWGVSGVFLSGILQVPTVQYAPFAFFCLLCPVITIITGFANIGITRITKREHATM